VVQVQVQNAPLCRRELFAVSVPVLEEAERLLMEGLNFELRCHHPDYILRSISRDLARYLSSDENEDESDDGCKGQSFGERSPRAVTDYTAEYSDELLERAMELKQKVLVDSDAHFLFAPNHLAFAILALVLRSVDDEGRMGMRMYEFLLARFPRKSPDDISKFASRVSDVIRCLLASPKMNFSARWADSVDFSETETVTEQAEEIREVLISVANIRILRQMARPSTPRKSSKRKRSQPADYDFTPPRHFLSARKYARVTPNTFRHQA